jgi:molecular chaperone GrpE (heat shock protein)
MNIAAALIRQAQSWFMSAPASPRSNKHMPAGFCPDKAVGSLEHVEVKQEFDAIMEEWHEQTENLKQQLEEIKTTSAEAWQDAERRINAGMEKLRKLYERARSALS